jgi:hypothetical protein
LPALNWVAPRDGERLDAGTDVELRVEASSAAPIEKVEFFAGQRKLGEATTSPFSVVWSGVPAGAHCLLARATDPAGFTKTSPSVVVRARRGR